MISTSWPVAGTHSALSIAPAAGFNRDRAATSASSDSASTDLQAVAARPPIPPRARSATSRPHRRPRRAAAAWRGDPAAPAARPATSASVTPAGACTTTVWLNWSVGPSTSCSHRMIGVATTGPMPSSTTAAVAARRPGHPGQPGHGLLDEDVARPAQQPGRARPRHHLHRQDAVAAEVEERVVDADPLDPEHLRRRCRPGSPRPRSPERGTRSASWYSGAGRARVSSLPLTVSGSASNTTTAAGTM